MSRSEGERQAGETGRSGRLIGTFRWLPYLPIFLPGALSVAYVYQFGVSVVVRDQWEMVTLFRNLFSGELSFLDLWEPHNEHRFLFPRIVMLSLGVMTEWNNLAEMYLIQACLFATLIGLLLAFRAGGGSRLFFFIPIAFLVFSLRQSQNMLWGYQITFAFAQTFGVLALFFLYISGRGNLRKVAFSASLLSGTVAAFSAIQGLLVWPAGLLQLLLTPLEKATKRILIAVWGLVGAGEWIVYFLDYERDVGSSLSLLLASPVTGAEFFLTLLGSPLFPQRGLILVGGAILAGLIALSSFLIFKERKLGEYSFWLSLLVFSLFVSLSVMSGRIRLGVEAATASKYTTFSILAVVCVYVITVRLWSERRSHLTTALLGVSLVTISLSIPVSYWNGINLGREVERSREEAAFILSTYESQPDELLETLHRRPGTVERRAPILKELGYNVFSEPEHKRRSSLGPSPRRSTARRHEPRGTP